MATQCVETKLVKGPTTGGGDKKTWRHWSNKPEGYVAGIRIDLLKLNMCRRPPLRGTIHI